MSLPNVIIVGAIKSGTTYLWSQFVKNNYSYLVEKEGRFFSNMSTSQKGGISKKFQNAGYRNLNDYLKSVVIKDKKKMIDASCDYFYYYEKSIKNIFETYKQINANLPIIIIILRDPVSRVWSLFNHIYRLDKKNYSFKKMFVESKTLINKNYSWVYDLQGNSLSYDACKAYYQNFEKVIFIDYKNLTNLDYLNKKMIDLIKIQNQANTININHYKSFKSNFLQKIIEFDSYPYFLKKNNFLKSMNKSLKKFNLGREINLNNDYIKMIDDFSKEDYVKAQNSFLKYDSL